MLDFIQHQPDAVLVTLVAQINKVLAVGEVIGVFFGVLQQCVEERVHVVGVLLLYVNLQKTVIGVYVFVERHALNLAQHFKRLVQAVLL